MDENSAAERTISHLKSRLESALNASNKLEKEYSAQSCLLANFIGKLSKACKGTDILLDNKLADLRATLKSSTNFVDLEKEMKVISSLLNKHSLQNDKNIVKIHQQLQAACANLQKVKNLPDAQRRQLKALTDKTQQSPSALVQYVPLMSEFINHFENALQAQLKQPSVGLLNSNKTLIDNKINKVEEPDNDDVNSTDVQVASKEMLERFNAILNSLVISEKHKSDISEIKTTLKGKVSNQVLMTKCLNVFDYIIEDLKQERSTAKIFLSTLSESLTSVQASVSSTISNTLECNVKHDGLNKKLSENLTAMSSEISDASSLGMIKVDVNEKIEQLTQTLKEKNKLEEEQREHLLNQLTNMTTKVEQLEQQSQNFEKRIKEQQQRSMQDALTKLSNRAAFDEYFAREIVRFNHKAFELAITVIDLDDFKRINDNYGHTAGDKTLQVIANALKSVIGDDAFISRYGGEEFVLIFRNANKNTVINKLNVLRKKVAALPFSFKNNRVNITLSIGITFIQPDDNVHSAFERADTALYRAKHNGKNCVIFG
jgi:diguanylate cyclase